MAVQAKALFTPSQLSTSASPFYAIPSTPASIILSNGRARFTNTDSAAHAVTLYAVPAAGTAGPGNCSLNAESVAPNTHLDVDLPVLGAGGSYQALADTASVVTVSQLAGILIS